MLSVIGAGWLGEPVARQYHTRGWSVCATRTHDAGVDALRRTGLDAYKIILTPDTDPATLTHLIRPITLVTVPFRRSLANPWDYLACLKTLGPALASADHSLFTSSTSVYTPENQPVDETTVIRPVTERQSVLLAVEQFFLTLPVPATVIRFGGLYGPGRHKGRFLQPGAPGGLTPVNMIHLDDCLGIINAVIQHGPHRAIYNAVHPRHLTKSAFYNLALQPTVLPHKRVLSDKVQTVLNYVFTHDPELAD